MLNPETARILSQVSRSIIILESNSLVTKKIVSALKPLQIPKEKYRVFSDDAEGPGQIINMLNRGMAIDLIIGDLFSGSAKNIPGLVARLENNPDLRNTPLILFTNDMSSPLFLRLKRLITHLPYRTVKTDANDKTILRTVEEIMSFTLQNKKYFELEARTNALIQTGNIGALPSIIKTIKQYREQYPLTCRPAKMDFFSGFVYQELASVKRRELTLCIDELQLVSPADKRFGETQDKLEAITKVVSELREMARQFFISTCRLEPDYWRAIDALYEISMEDHNLPEAKKYLSHLMTLFINSPEYYYKMGKINELEGETYTALQNYLEAARKVLDEGVDSVAESDILLIIDSSINISRKILLKLNASEIEKEDIVVCVERKVRMLSLRQNNAIVRSLLFKLAKQFPENVDYLNKIGITYRRAGEYRQASKAYLKAISIDSDNARIRANYSAVLGLSGAWKAAREEIEIALKLNNDSEDEVFLNHAKEIIVKGDLKGVKESFV